MRGHTPLSMLNLKAVHYLSPPKWLQTTYIVPSSEHLVSQLARQDELFLGFSQPEGLFQDLESALAT